MRRPVIGVMGGSKVKPADQKMAHALGKAVAQEKWVLLNGGRKKGVMDASAEGAHQAGGTVIGILPDRTDARASQHLDFAILTGLGDARNVINVLSSDVVVACPGALGTLSEIVLALKYDKPVILLGFNVGADFDRYRRRGQLSTAGTVEEAIALAKKALEAALVHRGAKSSHHEPATAPDDYDSPA